MKCKINISIDDVSPHPQSGLGVLERCHALIKIFPEIRFTLFIPMYYTRKNEQSYPLSEFPEFCKAIKELSKDNFEIGYHGYYHGILGINSNDEFQNLNYNQAVEKFIEIEKERSRTILNDLFKPIFRPPAWRMSQEAIKAALDCGIEILALSPKDYAQQTYGDLPPCDVVYYNVNPPFDELKLFDKTEIVYHACEWDRNYLNAKMAKYLENFLLKNSDKIEFAFMDGLV